MYETTDESGRTIAALRSRSFLALLVTQFLTALNDNIFRWLAIGIGKDYVAPGEQGWVLMVATICFVVPYIVLAAPAGYLADRFSKRQVIVWCKAAEVLLMVLAVATIVLGQLPLLMVVLFAMGAQSALFSPSKLGAIPELLPAGAIPAANGAFGLATLLAAIAGMAVGSQLKDQTGVGGREAWWISALVLVGVAVVGWAVSLAIQRLPAGDPKRPFPRRVLCETGRQLVALWQHRPLFRAAMGLVFFWALGSLAQLNIDQFAVEAGAVTEMAKTPLLAALIVGVGAGSVLAGWLARGFVHLNLVPAGVTGIALSACTLFAVRTEFFDPLLPEHRQLLGLAAACLLLFSLGCSAGLFSVPLDSYLQHRSPVAVRGNILAATNLLIFAGILGSSLLYYGLRLPLLPPGQLGDLPSDWIQTDNKAGQAAVTRVVEAFRSQLQAGKAVSVEDYLVQVPGQRQSAFVPLLWEEVQWKRRQGQLATEGEYVRRFPEFRRQIRAVLRTANPRPLCSARLVFLLAGFGTVPVVLYVMWVLPQEYGRFLAWLARWSIYRVRISGKERIPRRGPGLLVSNHVTWIDAALLLLLTPRRIRYVAWAGNFSPFVLRWFSEMGGAIMVVPTNPKSVIKALREARQALQNGELVCVFPEGGITRTGQLLGFRPGVMKILQDTDAPVIPVFLDELWGSIFSFSGGKFFWKLPRRFPYPVSIHVGQPLSRPADAFEIRQAVQQLGAQAMESRANRFPLPACTALRVTRRRLFQRKVYDSTRAALSGGQLVMRALILRRLLRRTVLSPDERYVGILLPPAAAAVVVNLAVTLDKRIACNLNYSASSEVINTCIAQAGIRHVLTSRRFMERMNFSLNAELVYLEDFRDRVTFTDKLWGAVAAYLAPTSLLVRWLGLHRVAADDLLTVIFTSGSTGTPKGVMLSHSNVAHNIGAVDQLIHLRKSDVVLGILPFFHSFGYTVTLWTVLCNDVAGAYHFSPLEAKQIGSLCKKHRGTILLATPTFLRGFIRRVDPDDFKTLDVVVAGAEKLPREVVDAFEQRFGVRPVEGYGTTELSPLVSVNIPPSRALSEIQTGLKEGSVGRPVPGVAVKIVHPETGQQLGCDQEGLLLVRGPNVMKGYLGRPDLTAEVLRDGWYVTGDMARIDEDGFIYITGRLSRFSKIGGEMVPHGLVEERINQLLGPTEDGSLRAVVTAVPDEKRGERLAVVHLPIERTPDEICRALMEMGLPNLYIPSPDSFVQVEELPILGSGKLDLKRLQQIAIERLGAKRPPD
ncbi:MAG: hypothetical protein KatS3mg110_2757 [Pirellulaceae bacterium]|nr:MAG: hypothetical protein KatS3mg110_2757 [Pirellulaceae bacterium]